jgi:hypothetical protein
MRSVDALIVEYQAEAMLPSAAVTDRIVMDQDALHPAVLDDIVENVSVS